MWQTTTGLPFYLFEFEGEEAVALRADRHAGQVRQGNAGLHLARLLVGQNDALLGQQEDASRALRAKAHAVYPSSLVPVNSEIIPLFVSDTYLWYITGLTGCNLRQQKQRQFFRCQKISDCSSGDENKTRLLSSLKQCVFFFSFFYCRYNKLNNKCCCVCVGDSSLTLPLALLILLTTSASRTFSSTALLSFWYLGFLLISR